MKKYVYFCKSIEYKSHNNDEEIFIMHFTAIGSLVL